MNTFVYLYTSISFHVLIDMLDIVQMLCLILFDENYFNHF